LNSVLDFKDEKTIVDVSIINHYQVSKILDIKATNKNGGSFIVEMQKRYNRFYKKKSLLHFKSLCISTTKGLPTVK